MKETTLHHTPKNTAFSKEIVKHLPQAIALRLPAEISVVAVSARESAALNRRYRHKYTPANVLSFLYDDISMSSSGLTRGSRSKALDSRLHGNDKRDKQNGRTYGEIIICPAIIRVEAKTQKHTFQYQMTWMIAHGMIHLSGLHHEKSSALAKRVTALEERIMESFKFQNSNVKSNEKSK
ncbi:MAG: rRNA maturation RNase YbeY [Candidatus Sungiibacteriota bacterium]